MAKPLSVSKDQKRNATPLPGASLRWSGPEGVSAVEEEDQAAAAEVQVNSNGSHPGRGKPGPGAQADDLQDLEQLQHENAQLRNLCIELEQALQEASQVQGSQGGDERLRELEAVLEEKSDTIRQLHQELQNAHSIVAEMEAQVNEAMQNRPPAGPAPREEELLTLSQELERERRQLVEDEQTLMEQMRVMEVSMARERAEMARQRNDLARLQSDIRHELERLEKSGAAVRKMEELKRQFADTTTRRGLAASGPATGNSTPQAQQPAAPQTPPKKDNSSIMGRLFRGGK